MLNPKQALKLKVCLLTLLLFAPAWVGASPAYPVHLNDSAGREVLLTAVPKRILSLVPGVTEIIVELGSADSLAGVTEYDSFPLGDSPKPVVGGFLAPSLSRMEALDPDIIFVSSLHRDVREHFRDRPCAIVEVEMKSIEDFFKNVELVGAVLDRKEQASKLNARVRNQIRVMGEKVAKIPVDKRKRVMRLMGRDSVMTPGDDSFQNEFIRAAGGIPPTLGKNGAVVEVSLEEWKRFNPQVIYGCGRDREAIERLLKRPGWEDVEAAREGGILMFPCELTCRASVHTGDFIAWLAASVYEKEFSSRKCRVLDEKRLSSKALDLDLDHVQSARVEETTIFDFTNKTLIIDFKKPRRVHSTLEGERRGVECVGNHGMPPPCWGVTHRLGFEASRNHILKTIGKSPLKSSFLFTGADMDNLAIRSARYGETVVCALVTAGVEGNALRMSADEGRFHEPGTINIILLPNMKLSSRAMARAVITATEAKSAALQDLDIRSSASPIDRQATGTGTDETLIVEGAGKRLDNAGGHSKLGELIARAVYDGVTEAVGRQNGIFAGRSVLRRLQERGIGTFELLRLCPCMAEKDNESAVSMLRRLEELLTEPRFSSLIETAFALSDAAQRGLVGDLNSFDASCRRIAEEAAGSPFTEWRELLPEENFPPALRMALNAVLNAAQAERPE